MSQRDAWFLGLLALAYLYVDSSPASRTMSDEELPAPTPSPPADAPSAIVPARRFLPVRVVPRAACPRDQLHAVAHRADGAIWCRGCDEAFYPLGAVLGLIAQPAGIRAC